MPYDIKSKFKNSPLPCWQGYERVPGTKPGSKGSCRKSSPVKNKSLTKVVGELHKASKMHKAQAETIDAHIKEMKGSPVKKADPRRTIGKGKNFNKVAKDKSATGAAAGGGMTEKGVREYRRNNPGSKLKTAVTTPPSKLKKGSKAAKRRKSFCARSKGWTGERGRAARRRWNC